MVENTQWVCAKCGRVLDDHQLKSITGDREWLKVPLCVAPGDIATRFDIQRYWKEY